MIQTPGGGWPATVFAFSAADGGFEPDEECRASIWNPAASFSRGATMVRSGAARGTSAKVAMRGLPVGPGYATCRG